ncbi:MAG: hypothetical protein WCW40_11930 [Bacteroidota bacterium]
MRISLFVMFSTFALAQVDDSIAFVPNKQFIPSFTASGTEHRLSYSKNISNSSFYAGLGGSFPTLFVRYRDIECLVSVSGTVYTTLASAGVKFNVTNADYYADVTFDFPLTDETMLRLGAGHTSHHLVDDGVAALGAASVINYARDYYQLFVAREIPLIRGFVYGGFYYNYSFLVTTRRDGQFLYQCGADGANLPLLFGIELYGAFDIKFRSEVHYGSTQSYQIGLRSRGEKHRAVRLAYTYRVGMEERGQFYSQRSAIQSVGLFFDF